MQLRLIQCLDLAEHDLITAVNQDRSSCHDNSLRARESSRPSGCRPATEGLLAGAKPRNQVTCQGDSHRPGKPHGHRRVGRLPPTPAVTRWRTRLTPRDVATSQYRAHFTRTDQRECARPSRRASIARCRERRPRLRVPSVGSAPGWRPSLRATQRAPCLGNGSMIGDVKWGWLVTPDRG